jgi:hypothetical protein
MKSLDKRLKTLRNKALRLWKLRVKEGAGHKCELCQSTYMLNAHHIESYRMCPALRYDERNGLCVCPRCHKFGRDAVHNSFIVPMLYLMQHRSFDLLWIEQHRNNEIEYNEETLTNIIKHLEAIANGEDKEKD